MRHFKGFLILIIMLLLSMLPLLWPHAASSLQADPTATPEATATPAAVDGETTALVVVVSTPNNDPPLAASTVMIFDGEEAVVIGETDNGTFRTLLPEGDYDVAVLHGSQPSAAMLYRDVDVSGSETVTLLLTMPAENKVTWSVRTPNGNPPKNGYTIVVSSAGFEVMSKTEKPLSAGNTNLVLRGDTSYDVLVRYGDAEVVESDIEVREDGEFTIALPVDEGSVDIFLQNGGEPLTTDAQVVVIDETGRELLSNTKVKDNLTVYLPAGATYRVIAQYGGLVAEDSVTVEAGGLHPVTLDFDPVEFVPSNEAEPTPEASSG